ncbi:MAG: hypothetical protein WDN00_09385 [Limisphaerales bacterium]
MTVTNMMAGTPAPEKAGTLSKTEAMTSTNAIIQTPKYPLGKQPGSRIHADPGK